MATATRAMKTLSVRVPKELMERLRRQKVPVGEIVRRALDRETRRREEAEWEERRRKAAAPMRKKISTKDIVEMVRETRDER